MIYAISLSIILFEKSDSRKSKNTVVKDLSVSSALYSINKENFGLAHLIRENSSIPFNDESYVNVRYYQVTQTIDSGVIQTSEVEYNHDNCSQDNPFSDIPYVINTGLLTTLHCPETQSFEITGAPTSNLFKYIQIKLSR